MLKTQELLPLKNEIKRLAKEGRSLRNQARATKGNGDGGTCPRHALRCDANGVGDHARILLILYAFLRKRPYETTETNTPLSKAGWLRGSYFAYRWRPVNFRSEFIRILGEDLLKRENLWVHLESYLLKWLECKPMGCMWGPPDPVESAPDTTTA